MPTSPLEQAEIQRAIDEADSAALDFLRHEAESKLHELNFVAGRKLLDKSERRAVDLAIEMLTRIDAVANGGGWWYRTKRRAQLVQMYFGS